MRRLAFNNDLWPLRWNIYNLTHFMGSILLAIMLGFWPAWWLGMLWEFGDMLKPGYQFYRPRNGNNWLDKLRRVFFYADGFSLQDFLVWDLAGAFVGCLIRSLIY